WRTDAEEPLVRQAAARVGGHATLFRGGDRSAGVFTPLKPAVLELHRRLKAEFDPNGIFNPGRLVAGPSTSPDTHGDASRRVVEGHRRRRRSRIDPAQMRALRLLHGHLPDLPAARRRPRRTARTHLPDETGRRRAGRNDVDADAPGS